MCQSPHFYLKANQPRLRDITSIRLFRTVSSISYLIRHFLPFFFSDFFLRVCGLVIVVHGMSAPVQRTFPPHVAVPTVRGACRMAVYFLTNFLAEARNECQDMSANVAPALVNLFFCA